MTLEHKNILDLLQNKKTNGLAVYSNKSNHYSELNLFRHQIDTETLGPNHHPYTAQKRNVRTYQAVFFTIGIFYLSLGVMLYFKTFTWSYAFLFGDFSIAFKTLVGSLCGVAAATSFSLGFAMKTEREVKKNLYRKAKSRLKQIYKRKMAKFGVNQYLAIGEEREKIQSFRQMYEDALEKLHDQKEEAAHLLERISRSNSVNSEQKERLFNQAILEMNERMTLVVNSFRSTNHKRLLAAS